MCYFWLMAAAHCAAAPQLQQPLEPELTPGPTIIALPDAHVRDCTPPLLWEQRFHMYCTHVPEANGTSGYFGTVHHFYSPGADPTAAPWLTSGAALTAGSQPWETFGVFTPGAMVDASVHPPLWRLTYGAVGVNFTRDWPFKNFTEAIGLASSPSPFGPWARSPHNPIATTGPRGSFFEERIDNARPNVLAGFGGAALLIKGVRFNFEALPGLWKPAGGAGFDGAWTAPAAPLVNASAARDLGFENQEVMWGPDGLLHMIGKSHGCSTTPRCNQHFVSRDEGATWAFAGVLREDLDEPAPVFNGTVPPTAYPPLAFVQFFEDNENGKRLSVRAAAIAWVPAVRVV